MFEKAPLTGPFVTFIIAVCTTAYSWLLIPHFLPSDRSFLGRLYFVSVPAYCLSFAPLLLTPWITTPLQLCLVGLPTILYTQGLLWMAMWDTALVRTYVVSALYAEVVILSLLILGTMILMVSAEGNDT